MPHWPALVEAPPGPQSYFFRPWQYYKDVAHFSETFVLLILGVQITSLITEIAPLLGCLPPSISPFVTSNEGGLDGACTHIQEIYERTPPFLQVLEGDLVGG